MTAIEARDWFRDVATRLKEIQHTDQDPRFFRNVDELKKRHRKLKKGDEVYLVLDEPKGRLNGQDNQNITDFNTFGFWVLSYVASDDWENEDVIYDKAKTIMFKIYGKAWNERVNFDGLFKRVDLDAINYGKSGPE
ncbi:MAG: hypothetical protein AAF391_11755, partial [Bacteroidota bacterium]